MKKPFLITLTSILLIFLMCEIAFAAPPPGVLRELEYDSCVYDDTIGPVPYSEHINDGDDSSYAVLFDQNYSFSWYFWAEEIHVTGYYLNAEQGIKLVLSDVNGNDFVLEPTLAGNDYVACDYHNIWAIAVINEIIGEKILYEVDVRDDTPMPPNNLTIDENSITCTSGTITWDPVLYATNYYVYVNGVKVGTTSSTSYYLSNLQPNTYYEVTISGVNSSNKEGEQSSPISFTTDNLGVPTGLYIDNITSTTGNVHWSGVPGATSYNVYLNGNQVGTISSTSYTITGLQPSASYQVTVSAKAGSYEGQQSSAATFTTEDLGTPTGVYVDNITSTSGTVHWGSVPGATGYNVYLNGNQIGNTSSTSYEITGLESGIGHWVTISAVAGSIEGQQSDPVSFMTEDTALWTPLPGTGMGFPIDTSSIISTLDFFFDMFKGSMWPFIAVFLALFTIGLLWKIWRRVTQ